MKSHFHTDDVLLEMIKQGDKQAFSTVYHQYAAPLYHAAYAILKDREACEDIIQELFTDLWTKRQQLDIRHLKAYLYRSVKNNVLMTIRSGRINVQTDELEEAIEARAASDSIIEKELRQAIDKNVAQLPEQCRTIYMLSRDEQLSHKEIAHQLSISAKTVENQITIALRRLRSSLGDAITILLLLLLR